jgi:hypothetical protein
LFGSTKAIVGDETAVAALNIAGGGTFVAGFAFRIVGASL